MTDIKTDKIDLLPDTVNPEGFQLQSVVGMQKEAAIELLNKNGRKWHIIQEDGNVQPSTHNFLTGRVSLVIDEGVVSSYRLG